MLVHTVKASEVRRWEASKDLEIQLVRKVGEMGHPASGERRVYEGDAKGGVLGKRCQWTGSKCFTQRLGWKGAFRLNLDAPLPTRLLLK